MIPSCQTLSLLARSLLGTLLIGALPSQAQVVITEFLAENSGGLLDSDGATPDWIEIHNTAPTPTTLTGWALTDDPVQPQRWPIPVITLAPDERRIIFASGKNRTNLAAELHTNFSISKSAGGFLALRRPDGSFATLFSNYPEQQSNISYGTSSVADSQALVNPNTPARLLIPTNATLGDSWKLPAFNDSAWLATTSRIGYQLNSPGTGLPIAYWTFDDTDENAIPNAPPVTRTGATYNPSTPGQIGSGKSLDFLRSSSQYATANLDVSETTYSCSFWFRTTQSNTGLYSVSSGNLGADGHDRHLYLSGGNIRARTWNDETITSTGKNYADNQWHHVTHVVGNTANGQRIYVDGIQVAAGNKAQSDFNWQSRIHIGFSNDSGGTTFHQGQIDDVSIWSETLGPAAIAILASGTSPDTLAGFTPHIGTNVQSAMHQVNATAYLRLPFTVNRTIPFNHLELRIRYDDGFIAFIDGVEVARRNAPSTPTWQSSATTDRPLEDAIIPEIIDLTNHLDLIPNGNHVLTIHALNNTAASPDFLINAELHAATITPDTTAFMDPPTPGSPNITGFSGFVSTVTCTPPRGLYSSAQSITITCATPGATIAYTNDGSDPSPTNGTQIPASSPLTPPSFTLPVTSTRTIRTMAYLPSSSLREAKAESHSYILLPQVLVQPNNPPGFPSSWLGRTADYGMDPNVVNQTLPGYSVTDSLLSLPTISVNGPIASLFSTTAPLGIYYDTSQRGLAGERKVSIEWINPDGSPGWHANAGIRPHGNSSRGHSFTPKHPLRLNFRSEYGDSKLRQNLYQGGVTSFDQLLLRGCSTDSMPVVDGNISDGEQRWNNDKATYIRDQYIRDLLNELGHPNCRGLYAHLYLNGLYWGLYNLAERPTAEWFSATFGGQKEEWDVLKDFQEVNDGDAAAWNAMTAIINDTALTDTARCQKLLGNNPDGTRNPAFPIYLHWPSFRDYMIVHIAAGAEDWPDHNYWVGRRRGPESEGFRFVAWDQEISNDSLTRLSGRGSNAPFESVGDPAADSGFTFGPAKIYDKFRRAEPFKSLFRDRTHQLLNNGGALTPQAQRTRWNAIQQTIDKAIVAESARWGDANGEGAKKRETTWLNNMAYMNTPVTGYWDAILPIAIQRFTNVSLYPLTAQPTFSQNGGFVPTGFQLFLSHPQSSIHYTTDGTDPKGSNNQPSPQSQLISGGVITETPVPAASAWKYLVTPSAPDPSWTSLAFNDSPWPSGNGQLGYGDADEATLIGFGGNTSNRYITTYFRRSFSVSGLSTTISARAMILRDDGAVVHLNGVEIGRTNMPNGPITYSTTALSNPSGTQETTYYEISIPLNQLVEGNNVLSVEVHKFSPSDGDLSFDARIELIKSNNPTPITLTSSGYINARARTPAGEWSGLNSHYFAVGLEPPSPSNIVISELHYHPADPTHPDELAVTTDADAYEFIELTNVGQSSVDLSNTHLADGVLFDFPLHYTLAPGQRCVVVRNQAAFQARYGTGHAIAGIFGSNNGNQTGLNNSGETLSLTHTSGDTTTTLFTLSYDDSPPWPTTPDGSGPSLMLRTPQPGTNHNDPSNWVASADTHGTPGLTPNQFSYSAWLRSFPAATNPQNDDDHDGIPNLIEYALLTNPLIPDPAATPSAQLTEFAGSTYPSITFRHRPTTDLDLTVQTSGNLTHWTTEPDVVRVSQIDHGDGSFTETWRTAQPLDSNGNTPAFLRLHAAITP